MGKCIVCGKEATKFAWTMYSDDGQAIPSSLDTFGWCDEHYLDRHKYVIFENEDALELFKRTTSRYLFYAKPENILFYRKPSIELPTWEEIELIEEMINGRRQH